jgi:hypothetical protein
MHEIIELTDAETAAVSGGLLNNIFVNTAAVSNSFNTNSGNTSSFNPTNSNNVLASFNNLFSNNSI